MTTSIIFVLAAYVVGSIPFAILWSKVFGLGDPREKGSGNPGATNVLRSGNKVAALLTLLCDFLKGFVPVFIADQMGFSNGWIALVAMAAFLGHLYPVFLKFRGGKGVATALGVFAALSATLVLCFIIVWLLTAVISRYSSLSAMVAGFVTIFVSFIIFNKVEEIQLIGAVIFIVAFIFNRHRDNLNRLRAGTESKIGSG